MEAENHLYMTWVFDGLLVLHSLLSASQLSSPNGNTLTPNAVPQRKGAREKARSTGVAERWKMIMVFHDLLVSFFLLAVLNGVFQAVLKKLDNGSSSCISHITL